MVDAVGVAGKRAQGHRLVNAPQLDGVIPGGAEEEVARVEVAAQAAALQEVVGVGGGNEKRVE